jgi:C-terminal processing protease CtpA/Prc
MSYHGFSGNREDYNKVLDRLRAVLDQFSTAKTLIIDARSHPGGGLDDMDVMFSYFFDKPTTLVMMDTRLEVEQRGSNPLTGHPTLQKVGSPEGIVRRAHLVTPLQKSTGLSRARIFLLTSGKTASAGEHLTLALKRTGRATLIGERTRGAGHFGRTAALGGGYRAFIPVGRTFDPDTDKGWEQTGIEPRIRVPAEKALDEALKRIGVSPDEAKKALESFKTE